MIHQVGTEDGPWDTSKAHARRVFEQCIEMGRRARNGGRKDQEYEALRLLGTAVSHGFTRWPVLAFLQSFAFWFI